MDEYLAESSVSRQEYGENLRKQAEAIVRRSLVLDKIGDEMDVSVGKEDFEAEMGSLASTYGIDAERLVNSLFKDEKRLTEMANRIKYKKTVSAIMDTITVNDTEVAEEEPAQK